MSNYKLVCCNHSRLHGAFAVYQSPPTISSPGEMITMAWLSRPAAPRTRVAFTWSNVLCFVWGENGRLGTRVMFEASQSFEADPMRENTIDLAMDKLGAPMFQNLRVGGAAGALTINQLNYVFDKVSVGVGMDGTAAYAVEANANVTSIFMPHRNQYWVVFGDFMAGQVFDVESISRPLLVEFDRNAPTQTVNFTMDNMLQLEGAR
ncbi:hypothetical protein JZU57_01500 [bacterium]|nr:hypothetical protein [bacterium]